MAQTLVAMLTVVSTHQNTWWARLLHTSALILHVQTVALNNYWKKQCSRKRGLSQRFKGQQCLQLLLWESQKKSKGRLLFPWCDYKLPTSSFADHEKVTGRGEVMLYQPGELNLYLMLVLVRGGSSRSCTSACTSLEAFCLFTQDKWPQRSLSESVLWFPQVCCCPNCLARLSLGRDFIV